MTTKAEITALYNQGMTILSGQQGEPGAEEMERAKTFFSKAAGISPVAKAKLAVVQALMNDGDAAVYVEAVMSGMPALCREMAVLLLGAGQGGMAAGLLRRAASQGDWIAAFLILREGQRERYFAKPDELKRLVAQLTPAVPFREGIINYYNNLGENINILSPHPIQRTPMLQAVSAYQNFNTVTHEHLSKKPDIVIKRGLLSPIECDYLIAMSCGLMQPSKVVDATRAGSIGAGYRTSDGAVLLPVHLDLPLVYIMYRLAKAAGARPEQGEFLSLLRYRPGQEYRPHHDYLEEDALDYSKIKACGQRCLTLLTYLNDGYEGGATAFPKCDVSFKGETGDGLLFENTDNGEPILQSLHAGLPVTAGEKWLATLWIREKPFWPWAR